MTAASGIGTYACMPRAELADGALAVRAVQPGDIESIRRWRNAQLEILRQAAPIEPDEQVAYYARAIWPDKARATPANLLLAYLRDGRLIGYGGLVHIAWPHRRAEVSFLLDPELERDVAARAALFAGFLGLVKRLGFDDLGLARLYTETFDVASRVGHARTLEAVGFRLEGRLRGHVRIDGDQVDSLMHGCLAGDPR
jgi:RimJ/RimL family protein N-acetyltransferase